MPCLLTIATVVVLASAAQPEASAEPAAPGDTPLEGRSGADEAPALPPAGATPLDNAPGDTSGPWPEDPWPSEPTQDKPKRRRRTPKPPPELPPRTSNMVRADILMGMVWRTRTTEPVITVGVGYGRLQGFSGTFHTSIIIAPDRDFVRVIDVPIGLGAVLRGRLKNQSVFGSVGLSAGILVHRSVTPDDVIHRVDPDFRLPIRFAWTARRVGLSVALVQGYNVRNRRYERRGVPVWERSAYRIGVLLGLHFDIITARSGSRRAKRESP
ncbi:MAG: hypothetical protein H6713_13340 [Myxococcales bacterium]|nr:hypothetical protein [Myxococcales bacterium]